MSQSALSVVIPAHNAARFLPAALDSVFAQGIGEMEVVVVDDGSTDGTAEVARAYGRGVRALTQPASGSARARNRGIEATTGELIAFLDADDLWLPEKTRLQLALLHERTECGMVFSDGVGFDDRGDRPTTYLTERGFDGTCRASSIFLYDMIMTPTVIVRRRCLEAAGPFDESLPIGQDSDLFFRLALRFPFGLIDRPLVRRRFHGDNVTKNHRLLARCAAEVWGRHLPACVAAEPEMRPRLEAFNAQVQWNHHFQEGCALLKEGNRREARRHLSEAMRLDPLQPRPWAFYATSWLPR